MRTTFVALLFLLITPLVFSQRFRSWYDDLPPEYKAEQAVQNLNDDGHVWEIDRAVDKQYAPGTHVLLAAQVFGIYKDKTEGRDLVLAYTTDFDESTASLTGGLVAFDFGSELVVRVMFFEGIVFIAAGRFEEVTNLAYNIAKGDLRKAPVPVVQVDLFLGDIQFGPP